MNIGKETEQIEYKKSTGELKEGIISIVAMLNKHGKGELFFEVKNNGDVIGQEISDSTLRDISQAVSNHIKPAIYPEIETKSYGDKEVVYVRFEGNRVPYLAYNIPRIRVADEDKVMDQETYDDMLRFRGDSTKAWELQVSEYTINDIVDSDFQSYLRKAKEVGRIEFESDEPAVVLDKLELLAKDGEHLLNAGAVLFCRSSMNDVQMAKFATDVKATFIDIRREDRGSIIGLGKVCVQYILDAMGQKIRTHTPHSHSFRHLLAYLPRLTASKASSDAPKSARKSLVVRWNSSIQTDLFLDKKIIAERNVFTVKMIDAV